MPKNWKQLKAIEAKNKKRILEICPSANDESGIYVFLRYEGEFKYAYIGQAKHLLTRLAQHLTGYKHIDLSIKRHGLYSVENPTGWQLICANYSEDALDDTERELIAKYANRGYQLRNKTAGGQDSGKFGIDNNRPVKGYYDGLQQGYENARKEVKHLFDLHLVAAIKANKPNKTQEKALKKFYDFINGGTKK